MTKHGFMGPSGGSGARRLGRAATLAFSLLLASGVLATPALAAVSITGTPEQGKTLTATDAGDTTGAPGHFRWSRCNSGGGCPTLVQTGGGSYTLTANDVGSRIRVVDTTDSTSSTTRLVFPELLGPVIAGSTAVGQALTAVPQWSAQPPSDASFSFAWSRCDGSGGGCTGIQGATGSQYTPTSADIGHVLQVAVTDTEPSGASQHASAQTAAIASAAQASSTFMVTTPGSSSTNHSITLIATVTAITNGRNPVGTVAFSNRGVTVPGCGAVPAATFGQSVTVICQASFGAAGSPQQLFAAFTPTSGSTVTSATSAPLSLGVRRDVTTSSITVSNATVAVGHSATYKATIHGSLHGPLEPSGTVEFFNHGKPLANCLRQRLKAGKSNSTATCTFRFTSSQGPSIIAKYAGDSNFAASHSGVASSVPGTVTSTMQWSFHFTPTYTRVLALLINSVAPGVNVFVTCHGGGCPFGKRSTTLSQKPTCVKKGKGKRVCTPAAAKDVDLESQFRNRRLGKGAQVSIFLTHPQWVGKYYQFTMRNSAAPRIQISCLAAGSSRPGVGC